MKFAQLFLLPLGLLFLHSCITIVKAPSRMPDDGSTKASSLDSTVLLDKSGFRIEQIDYSKLQALINCEDTFWVMLWAPWCAPCISNLMDDTYLEKAATHNIKPDNLIFISTNYDLTSIEKYLHKTPYRSVTYVLDAKAYGKDENTKISEFTMQVTGDSAQGVPQHFIFANGELVHHNGGNLRME